MSAESNGGDVSDTPSRSEPPSFDLEGRADRLIAIASALIKSAEGEQGDDWEIAAADWQEEYHRWWRDSRWFIT